MKMIDSHCHVVTSEAYEADRQEVMKELELKMEAIIECASSSVDFEKIAGAVGSYGFVYGAVGVHPEEAESWNGKTPALIRQYLSNSKIVAVGEIGLDYYWRDDDAALQRDIFLEQLLLAKDTEKPAIIHSRSSMDDVLEIIGKARGARGVVHCFSEGKEHAKKALDLGMYLGFGGVLTYKKPGDMMDAFMYAPLDRILLETDSPYLSPVPFRGRRNRPDYVEHTVKKMAELRGLSHEDMLRITNENAKRLFSLGDEVQ